MHRHVVERRLPPSRWQDELRARQEVRRHVEDRDWRTAIFELRESSPWEAPLGRGPDLRDWALHLICIGERGYEATSSRRAGSPASSRRPPRARSA